MLCLLGDLVKAKWAGRQHHQHQHQHQHQHRHAAASMEPVWSPETPSRAARASAAFRQESCLQRGVWPPSAALPASAMGANLCRTHAMLVVGLRAMRQRVFCRLRLRLHYEQRLTVRQPSNQRAAGPGQGEHLPVSACQPVVPSLARAVPHTPETRTAVGAHDVCTVSVDFLLLNMFLINCSGCWLVAANSCCLLVSGC